MSFSDCKDMLARIEDNAKGLPIDLTIFRKDLRSQAQRASSALTYYENLNKILLALQTLKLQIVQLEKGNYKIAAENVLKTYGSSLCEKGLNLTTNEQAFIIKTAAQMGDILDKKFESTTLDDLTKSANEISLFDEKLYLTLAVFAVAASIASGIGGVYLGVMLMSEDLILFAFVSGVISTIYSGGLVESAQRNLENQTTNKARENAQEPVRRAIRTFADTDRVGLFFDSHSNRVLNNQVLTEEEAAGSNKPSAPLYAPPPYGR